MYAQLPPSPHTHQEGKKHKTLPFETTKKSEQMEVSLYIYDYFAGKFSLKKTKQSNIPDRREARTPTTIAPTAKRAKSCVIAILQQPRLSSQGRIIWCIYIWKKELFHLVNQLASVCFCMQRMYYVITSTPEFIVRWFNPPRGCGWWRRVDFWFHSMWWTRGCMHACF